MSLIKVSMERWMSGLNQQFTKLSFPLNGTVGSNPTLSATV